MFKRILLCSALALMSSASLADDGPAWGLIVKLKPETTTSSATNLATSGGVGRAQAQQVAPSGQARLQAAMQRVGLGSLAHRALPDGTLHHVGTEQVVSHDQAQLLARQLLASGAVEWAVPNERQHLLSFVTPNDGMFSSQWWAWGATDSISPIDLTSHGLPNLALAWGTTTGSATTTVAVLDTGIISHVDIDASRLLAGRNFHHRIAANGSIGPLDGNANDPTDPGDYLTQAEKNAAPVAYADCPVADSSWHGTAVTGVIAATANTTATGIAGANWSTRILPVRIAGKCGAWESDIISAMNWVAGDASNGNVRRADVINLSFGGTGSCASDPAYQTAITLLHNRGVALVVAAGNEHGAVARPANCPGVISVAALNRDGFKANYSNFGAEVTLSTVGGDPMDDGAWGPYLGDSGILTLGNQGTTTVDTNPAHYQYYYYAGTSLAAPIVSATVALMRGLNPALSVSDITTALTTSARPHVISSLINACSSSNPGRCICTTQTCGAGILDADRALQYVNGQTLATLSPINIDNVSINAAKAASSQDTVSTAVTGPAENHGGGGGGGATSALALAGLAGAVGAAARTLRAQRSRTA